MQKVLLQPGESTTVALATDGWRSFCTFCSVDAAGERAVRPGRYVFQLGGDARGPQPGDEEAVVTADVVLSGPAIPAPL